MLAAHEPSQQLAGRRATPAAATQRAHCFLAPVHKRRLARTTVQAPSCARHGIVARATPPFGGGGGDPRQPQQHLEVQKGSPVSTVTEDEPGDDVLDPFAHLAVYAPAVVRRHSEKHVTFASEFGLWGSLTCDLHGRSGKSNSVQYWLWSQPTAPNKTAPQRTVPPAELSSPISDVLRCPNLRHLPELQPRTNPLLRLLDRGCVSDDDR